MNQNDVSAASPAPVTAIEALRQVLEDPSRLGLGWELRAGTVANADPLQVVYDGDTVALTMTSMVGTLSEGQRVWVIRVPPSGHFVIGSSTGPMYRARKTVETAQSSVTFDKIPKNLRSLTCRYTCRSDAAAQVVFVAIRINGVSSASYFSQQVQGNNATPSAAAFGPTTSGVAGFGTGALAGAGSFGYGTIDLQPWDQPNSARLGWVWNSAALGSAAANFFSLTGGGLYGVSTPTGYTSLTLLPSSGSWIAGSDFQLEGAYS